jgi:hypothetical protein
MTCEAIPGSAQELDSLQCSVQDGMITAGFLLPIPALKLAGMDEALDEKGLQVECWVSLEVKKSGLLRSSTLAKTVTKRILSYSRWYDEYLVMEKSQEIFSSPSYYKSLDFYRRYSDLVGTDVSVLESDGEYRVVLEVKVSLRMPDDGSEGGMLNLAGFGLSGELMKLVKSKGEVLSVKVESEEFAGGHVPSRLLGDTSDADSPSDARP